MVKSIINVRRSLDMLANVVGRLITDVQKTQKSWLWRHCRRRAIYWLLRSPSQTCHMGLNSNQQAPDATDFFPRWWDAYRKQLGLRKLLHRKVGTAVACSRLRSVALPMIDRGDIRQAIDRCSNIWASLPGAGYGRFEHKADSLITKIQRSAGGTVREITVYEQSHRVISALVICIIVCLSWAVNHYRDNAITYKAQRDKNARELKLANWQLLTCRCVGVMLLRSMQNTRS